VNRVIINLCLIAALLLFIQGCGYHSPYARPGKEQLPTADVYLSVWANKTNELGLENQIYQKIVDWIQQSRHLKITTDKERADYLLEGTVESVNYPATAFSTTDVAATLKASVRTSYHLLKHSTGSKVWEVKGEIREQSYDAGTDVLISQTGTEAVRSQSNKKAALTVIADEIAELVYLKITDTLIAENR